MPHRLLIALLVIAGSVAGFAPVAPVAKAKIETASWLAGTWESDKADRAVTEHWMKPAGGTMLGMSRTVAKGRTLEHEFMLLHEAEDGGLFYVARPSRQAEATFKLARATSNELVFENPAHDFPQRITYTLKNSTNLVAAIEGTKNGETRRIEFLYSRIRSSH